MNCFFVILCLFCFSCCFNIIASQRARDLHSSTRRRRHSATRDDRRIMSHTALYRLNALGTYVIVVLAALVAAASFTDVAHQCDLRTPKKPIASVVGIERFIRAPSGAGDEAVFAFDLDVDLASCFSWNTKLVFASVTVGYETEERDHNEATVWDRVARGASEADGAKTKGRVMAKYKLRSVDEDLRGKEMTVKVRWAVTPRAGRLWRGETTTSRFTMPTEYVTPRTPAPKPKEQQQSASAAGGGESARVPGMP